MRRATLTGSLQVYDGTSLVYQSQTSDVGMSAIRRRTRALLERHASDVSDSDVRLFVKHHVHVSAERLAPVNHQDLLQDEALDDVYGQETTTIRWQRKSTGQEIELPEWYGRAVAEVLFEADGAYTDTDQTGLGRLARTVYEACPIDVRSAMRRVLVVDEGLELPGLSARLKAEIPGSRVVAHALGSDLAWTGASLAAALKWHGPTLTAFDWQSSAGLEGWNMS